MACRILVVDDEPDSREALALLLTIAGYESVPAEDGRTALGVARECRPDLILLDLMMPVMDGFAFRAEQLRDPAISSIPVVCTSAVADPRVASQLGVECLTKPLDIGRLLDRVKSLCTAA